MVQLFEALGQWTWWIVAGVLFVLELMAPGIFFLWLGLAAIVVGTTALFVDMTWQVEVGAFAVLSVVSLALSRRFVSGRAVETDQPNLNKRMLNYVGRSYVLEQPIVNGRGELRIDDTIWKIRGNDSDAGTWVRIADVDGVEFVVEEGSGPGGQG